MDKYEVKINPKAVRNLEKIYQYIAKDKLSPENAQKQTERIKRSILGLKVFPQAHQERNQGRYANRGYRQLLIDNYIVIYRIDEQEKNVYVVTIQYQGRNI